MGGAAYNFGREFGAKAKEHQERTGEQIYTLTDQKGYSGPHGLQSFFEGAGSAVNSDAAPTGGRTKSLAAETRRNRQPASSGSLKKKRIDASASGGNSAATLLGQ